MVESSQQIRGNQAFATTRWSQVLEAGARASPEGDRALESLCQTYWYPLYAYARRRGSPPEQAADLTQSFFAAMLERNFLGAADPSRGRFRTFLLTVFSRFLVNEHHRATALKRGGGTREFSIDVDASERRYQFEPTDDWTPERLYDRRWALTLLECVMEQMRVEYEARGKGELFAACQPFLTDSSATSVAEVAARFKLSESAVRVSLHRMRQRFGSLLQAQVAQTVDDAASVEDELRHLRAALRGGDS